MKPICFYHKADLDGVCSAAIVKHFVPDCELYGIDYGDEFPWDKVEGLLGERMSDGPATEEHGASMRWKAKRTVHMVDFSLPPADMKRLAECSTLVWTDHHRTAIDACADIQVRGLLDIKYAACELTWLWFKNGAQENPVTAVFADECLGFYGVPEAVRLLGVYDSWRQDDPEWHSKVMPFQYGLRSFPGGMLDPNDGNWPGLLGAVPVHKGLDFLIDWVCGRGLAVLQFQKAVNRKAMETGSFEVLLNKYQPTRLPEPVWGTAEQYHRTTLPVLETLRVLACNTIVFNSQFFDGFFDPEKHDVMCAYAQMSDGRWKVSLYSTKPEINCGAICKTFGGGGHKGAAGFMCDNLPWES